MTTELEPIQVTTPEDEVHDAVRARYAEAALAVAGSATAAEAASRSGALNDCCGEDGSRSWGSLFYADADRASLPDAAVLASLGCGNPVAVAELREGETVLDLGSGGGIDVLLSARRVGPTRPRHRHRHDRRDARAGAAQRRSRPAPRTSSSGRARSRPCRSTTTASTSSSATASSTSPPTRAPSSPRSRGSCARAGGWASATSSPTTASRPPNGPSGAATPAASPAPCPSPSTATASRPRA